MAGNWLRRSLLLAAAAAAMGLAACGSGTIESQFNPTRVIAFGDGMSDLGQAGTRYTVNDATINIWTQEVAAGYGLDLVTASSGGTSYAAGNARVATKPDAAGSSTTRTIEEQVTAYLASGTFGATDLVLVGAGTSDIIAEAQAVITGARTRDQALANVRAAGRALGAQVRRIVQAGASHVGIAGPFNLGRTPWATAANQSALMEELSGKFNEDLLVSMVDLGNSVLYMDAALYFNLATASPGSYGFSNATTAACTSGDAGAGIGTGTGQVNSALCTATTAPTDYNLYVFADRVYPTPAAQRSFGGYAYSRLRTRW